MGVLSFISNMFGWNKNHVPQKTTITSTDFDPFKDPYWSEIFRQHTLTRKKLYKGFHWRRSI